jgi:hypothetical protein
MKSQGLAVTTNLNVRRDSSRDAPVTLGDCGLILAFALASRVASRMPSQVGKR